jgi:hypothetical protein
MQRVVLSRISAVPTTKLTVTHWTTAASQDNTSCGSGRVKQQFSQQLVHVRCEAAGGSTVTTASTQKHWGNWCTSNDDVDLDAVQAACFQLLNACITQVRQHQT